MEESSKIHCKTCGILKTRIDDGKYPGSQNKRYRDEEGKLWSGKCCPKCLVEKVKESMRKMRFKRQIEAEFHGKEDET